MADSDQLSSILERIQKLRKLADSTDFQAEAETATAMIQKLLLKYNLDIAEVEAHVPEFERSPVVEEFEGYGGAKEDWIVTLYHTVAKYNFCKVVRHQYNQTFSVVGRPANIEVVRALSAELVETARSASVPAYIQHKLEMDEEEASRKRILEMLGDRAEELSPWRHEDMLRAKAADRRAQFITSFYFGFVKGIGERLYKEWQDAKENRQTQALVLAHGQAVDVYMRATYPRLTHGRARSISSQAGYNKGFAEGSRAPSRLQLKGG